MYQFSSQHEIQERHPQRSSRHYKPTNQQMKIQNPFKRQSAQNSIPTNVLQELNKWEYISLSELDKITFQELNSKRNSNFIHHLNMMQNAAKKQEEKFNWISNSSTNGVVDLSSYLNQKPIRVSQIFLAHGHMDNGSNTMNSEDEHTNEDSINLLSDDYQKGQCVFYSEGEIGMDIEEDCDNII